MFSLILAIRECFYPTPNRGIMADDLFGMLYNDLEPKKQLLTAVSNDMIDSVRQLIKLKSFDINSQLMLQNGNTALHVCAQKGSQHIMRLLLEAQADPDIQNAFGMTPLAMALRNGHEHCVNLLFHQGGHQSDPYTIWSSTQMNDLFTWIGYSPDVVKILLIATPDFSSTGENTSSKFYHAFLHTMKSADLVKVFFLAGNGLNHEQMTQLLAQIEQMPNVELTHWLRTFQRGRSLQHLARVAIRKRLTPNVYYGSQLLPIPVRLREYLIFDDMLH